MKELNILICCKNSTSTEATAVENIESIALSIEEDSSLEIAVYGYTKIMNKTLTPEEAKKVGELIWQHKRLQ